MILISWEVAALLGHKLPGYSITELYAAADPVHMEATRNALDQLLRAVCVPAVSCATRDTGHMGNTFVKLERAKGFEPSTLTLAT
jgi:hypothetical protein